jgi:hypothetical protein
MSRMLGIGHLLAAHRTKISSTDQSPTSNHVLWTADARVQETNTRRRSPLLALIAIALIDTGQPTAPPLFSAAMHRSTHTAKTGPRKRSSEWSRHHESSLELGMPLDQLVSKE